MTDTAAPASATVPAPEADTVAPPAPAPRPRRDSRFAATSLIDEAAHALRLAPLGTLAIYYAGSLPFALGLLYFWADMARSPDAAERGAASAGVVAALFLAMKCAQAVFAARLRAQFAREPLPRWTVGRLVRVLLIQTGLQAPGLFILWVPVAVFLLPTYFLFNLFLASIVITPYGWVYAFYQNVTALGDGAPGVTARQVARRALGHTMAAPVANHGGLSILFLLAFFVWLNAMAAMFFLPHLAGMFTGEDNVFTRDPWSLFNTTTFLVSGVLVYLAVDPLAKTFYTLRCFHTDSTRTGDDLRTDLRALPPVDGPPSAATAAAPSSAARSPRPAGAAATLARVGLLALLLGLGAPRPARAAATALPSSPPPPASPAVAPGPSTVSPPALDQSVREVLQRREFAWRTRRETKPDQQAAAKSKPGWLDKLMDRFMNWLREFFKRKEPEPSSSPLSGLGGLNPGPLLQLLVYVVGGLLIIGVVYLFWSFWRNRKAGQLTGKKLDTIEGRTLTPDLSAEDVLATQLPEDEWLALARRLLAEGERRLAVRAMYLSLLSALGAKGLLTVARHRSNRDYLNELRRRLRDRPEGSGAFGRNVSAFERVWYGSHPVDDGLLATFEADREVVLPPAAQ